MEIILGLRTEATLNLAHLTTADSVALAKSVRYELTPHHLLLHDGCGLGQKGKVNPPLRHRRLVQQLYDAFKNGNVDIIASDHAPHTAEEKEGDFADAPSGMPGVETRIPLLMALAKRGGVSLETVQRSCCRRPAEFYRLNKGAIEVENNCVKCHIHISYSEGVKSAFSTPSLSSLSICTLKRSENSS